MTELETCGIHKDMKLTPLMQKSEDDKAPEARASIVKQMAKMRVSVIIDKTEAECDPTVEWAAAKPSIFA